MSTISNTLDFQKGQGESHHGPHNKARPWPKQSNALARLVLAVLLCVVAIPYAHTEEHSAAELTREYQLKAAFLFNFANFVKWPAGENDNTESELNFCLVGFTPVNLALQRYMAGKRVQGRTPTLKRVANINQAAGCHVLFISHSQQNAVTQLADTLGNSSVLTVGETPDFAQQGGVIEFMVVTNKLRFAINLEAAKRARLELSSQLLKLAQIVRKD